MGARKAYERVDEILLLDGRSMSIEPDIYPREQHMEGEETHEHYSEYLILAELKKLKTQLFLQCMVAGESE
ncbi:hypothetical protein KIN20_005815 [Parelaphostrongylus tenuis]|uniref:Uncharacterized protein n=1 Tax=Parelaphostrongylus tenuis TaxID=148309 RepID=A0AAD5MLM8_PARTN|nr:hypothetical protein KIN20_005815 [Parelaphostrongylus tenuis]